MKMCDEPGKNFAASSIPIVLGIALFGFILHLIFNNRYGYFRDEFDYIICGHHPAWGYVDQPPLLPILSRICLAVFGNSLRSVRLVPAISSAALIALTGMLTRIGRKTFRHRAQRPGRSDCSHIFVRREPAHQQLRSRSFALDGLCFLCRFGRKGQRLPLLALVRSCGRHRPGGKVFDCSARLRSSGWAAFYATAPMLAKQMDLAWWNRGIPDHTAEPAMEYALRLAFCAVNA